MASLAPLPLLCQKLKPTLLTSKFPTYTLRVPVPAPHSATPPPSATSLSAKKLPVCQRIGTCAREGGSWVLLTTWYTFRAWRFKQAPSKDMHARYRVKMLESPCAALIINPRFRPPPFRSPQKRNCPDIEVKVHRRQYCLRLVSPDGNW